MTNVEWLKELISFDTTSSQSNLLLINRLEVFCLEFGCTIRKTFNKEKTKANLFVTYPSKQVTRKLGLIFSGHTDVVPVSGQQWETHPFQALESSGKIYGRGAADMKGFIACVLSLLPLLPDLNLNFPVHFAFSYDEEVGCVGAPNMIADFTQAGIMPAGCIVGEPSNMQAIVGHKGISSYRCQVKGKAAHSSLTHEGCNAIDYAAKLVVKFREIAETLKRQQTSDNYDVPFTTLSTNLISGGIANNIIPSECYFSFDLRYLPEHNATSIIKEIQEYITTDILPAMHKEAIDTDIQIEKLASAPAFVANKKNQFSQMVSNLLGQNEAKYVAYATEAGQFEASGIPTIVCGPGSITEAHKPNEFVDISQLQQCNEFLLKLLKAHKES